MIDYLTLNASEKYIINTIGYFPWNYDIIHKREKISEELINNIPRVTHEILSTLGVTNNYNTKKTVLNFLISRTKNETTLKKLIKEYEEMLPTDNHIYYNYGSLYKEYF